MARGLGVGEKGSNLLLGPRYTARALAIVEAAEEAEGVLTEWERAFVDSLGYALGDGVAVTQGQWAQLVRIAEKIGVEA